MSKTFEFKAALFSYIKGLDRGALLKEAKDRYPGGDRARMLKTILEIIRRDSREFMIDHFGSYSDTIIEIFELEEGEQPSEHPESDQWFDKLVERLAPTLQGEAIETIGEADVKAWLASDLKPESLCDRILEKMKDAELLQAAGIRPADIAALAPRQEPMTAQEAEKHTPFVAGTHGSPELDADAAKLRALGADPGPTFQDFGSSSPATAAGQPAPARHKRSPVVAKSAYTDAAEAAVALLWQCGFSDEELAQALGVSRAQAIYYRSGKTKLAPTEAQLYSLKILFDRRAAEMASAWAMLEMGAMAQ